MKVGFDNILIPVDFTVNTTVAIRKALSLANGTNASIHLLHNTLNQPSSFFNLYQYLARYALHGNQFYIQRSKQKLERFRRYILGMHSGIEVNTWITIEKSIEKAIIEKSRMIGADLIIIGKNSHHSWLPVLNTIVPANIASKTGIAVLTVKPGSMDGAIRTVVVPIGEGFPYNKVAAINELKRRFRFQIRLITFQSSQDGTLIVPGSLLNAYRILKNSPDSQVSYEVIYGNNRTKSILAYCTKVNADLLIVNPETEMKIGWLNKQISDVLPVHSKTQILAVLQA